MEENNLTGYPHIDKPWMKYYSTEQKDIVIPNCNIVDYIKEKNKNNLSDIAESYYGKEFSFEELFYRVDISAKVLSQIGAKKGDVIASLISNIPEAGQLWFGATQIGAISDFIDPRPDGINKQANAEKMLEILKHENVKYIIALDFSYIDIIKPIEDKLKDIGIDTIIIVGADDSMSFSGKLDYLFDVIKYNNIANTRKSKLEKVNFYKALSTKLKMQKEINSLINESIKTSPLRVIKYKDLVKECENSKYFKISDGNLPNYIGHTSGTTTGKPKPIVLTNKNGIALAEQCEKSKFTAERGTSTFHLLPFFAPAGAFSNYLNNLSCGVKVIDVSEFYIGDFGYLIKKYKPNGILATPSWITVLPNYKLLTNEDLSYLDKIVYVGDSMNSNDIKNVKKWLKQHNSNSTLESAHGMSELGGCGSYATGIYNKEGSVGIPLPGTIYSVVDPTNEKEMVPIRFKNNESKIEGELAISAPNVTLGKLNDEIIVPHYQMDGQSYIRTKDIVEMDRDGVFYHKDRKDRSFVRIDGYKVKPYEIENVIEKNKYVKSARIVSYFDEQKNGLMPICHLVLKDNIYNDEVEIVKDIIFNTIITDSKLSSRQIPSKFKIRNTFPLTVNNKIDYKALTNEPLDGNEINVNIDETNLNIGDITISTKTKKLELK